MKKTMYFFLLVLLILPTMSLTMKLSGSSEELDELEFCRTQGINWDNSPLDIMDELDFSNTDIIVNKLALESEFEVESKNINVKPREEKKDQEFSPLINSSKKDTKVIMPTLPLSKREAEEKADKQQVHRDEISAESQVFPMAVIFLPLLPIISYMLYKRKAAKTKSNSSIKKQPRVLTTRS